MKSRKNELQFWGHFGDSRYALWSAPWLDKLAEAGGISALIFDGLYGSSILSSLLFTLDIIKCMQWVWIGT